MESARALRSAGILLHPTSLPGPNGIGEIGAQARRFVDWLAAARLTCWQVLPLVPPGAGDSPYATPSAMSGNPWLIDMEDLVEEGLLQTDEVQPPAFAPGHADFGAVYAWKGPLLARAAQRLVETPGHRLHAPWRTFAQTHGWARDAALFHALREQHGHAPWWQWPAALRDRDPHALPLAAAQLAEAVDRYIALQFLFDAQWRGLRRYAAARSVRLIGDLPIYVDADSADTWANPKLFQLGADCRPLAVAGVPPDYFSETGQFWGNPLYDWQVMQDDGYRWWIARITRSLQQTDLVRIDHFRGFSAYWAIPAGAADARTGSWRPGPGLALFQALQRELGSLPLIAEDLGVVDDALLDLRESAGLPGMKVLQFAFGGDAGNPFLPHDHTERAVVYTGTHDNDTTAGWFAASGDAVQAHVRSYLGDSSEDPAALLLRAAFASVCRTAIVPMQDVLGLGSEARMNLPGTTQGNWSWRMTDDALTAQNAERMARMSRLYGRDAALRR